MRTIDVVIYQDEDQWVAQALNVDVSSFGDSPEDAREAIREALHLFFEDEDSVDVHEARDPRVERVTI